MKSMLLSVVVKLLRRGFWRRILKGLHSLFIFIVFDPLDQSIFGGYGGVRGDDFTYSNLLPIGERVDLNIRVSEQDDRRRAEMKNAEFIGPRYLDRGCVGLEGISVPFVSDDGLIISHRDVPDRGRADHDGGDHAQRTVYVSHNALIDAEEVLDVIDRCLIDRPKLTGDVLRLHDRAFDGMVDSMIVTRAQIDGAPRALFKLLDALWMNEQIRNIKVTPFTLNKLALRQPTRVEDATVSRTHRHVRPHVYIVCTRLERAGEERTDRRVLFEGEFGLAQVELIPSSEGPHRLIGLGKRVLTKTLRHRLHVFLGKKRRAVIKSFPGMVYRWSGELY